MKPKLLCTNKLWILVKYVVALPQTFSLWLPPSYGRCHIISARKSCDAIKVGLLYIWQPTQTSCGHLLDLLRGRYIEEDRKTRVLPWGSPSAPQRRGLIFSVTSPRQMSQSRRMNTTTQQQVKAGKSCTAISPRTVIPKNTPRIGITHFTATINNKSVQTLERSAWKHYTYVWYHFTKHI